MIHLGVTLDWVAGRKPFRGQTKDGNRACVASVSDRVIARKLRREKKMGRGRGGEKRKRPRLCFKNAPLYISRFV